MCPGSWRLAHHNSSFVKKDIGVVEASEAGDVFKIVVGAHDILQAFTHGRLFVLLDNASWVALVGNSFEDGVGDRFTPKL